mmetsp:Transcript_43291/g.72172  ORF Transcript_43291/g.72172 Transcript_43291/m.72172 type:complete len:301 (+) Transcript_43291:303-1205(+)
MTLDSPPPRLLVLDVARCEIVHRTHELRLPRRVLRLQVHASRLLLLRFLHQPPGFFQVGVVALLDVRVVVQAIHEAQEVLHLLLLIGGRRALRQRPRWLSLRLLLLHMFGRSLARGRLRWTRRARLLRLLVVRVCGLCGAVALKREGFQCTCGLPEGVVYERAHLIHLGGLVHLFLGLAQGRLHEGAHVVVQAVQLLSHRRGLLGVDLAILFESFEIWRVDGHAPGLGALPRFHQVPHAGVQHRLARVENAMADVCGVIFESCHCLLFLILLKNVMHSSLRLQLREVFDPSFVPADSIGL